MWIKEELSHTPEVHSGFRNMGKDTQVINRWKFNYETGHHRGKCISEKGTWKLKPDVFFFISKLVTRKKNLVLILKKILVLSGLNHFSFWSQVYRTFLSGTLFWNAIFRCFGKIKFVFKFWDKRIIIQLSQDELF